MFVLFSYDQLTSFPAARLTYVARNRSDVITGEINMADGNSDVVMMSGRQDEDSSDKSPDVVQKDRGHMMEREVMAQIPGGLPDISNDTLGR